MDDSTRFPLLNCNPLVRRDSNVWSCGADAKDTFDYSDGDTAEEHLKDVIISAQDLTSQSLELEEKIIDWVSEYHLSPKRANLLRALNLDGIRNSLELGSGCGAITRYLGELGINLDAVEGNFKRAEITTLRCRDLENVNVINANFNELILPKEAYDAVFLIGVLEYAKKFSPNAVSDKNAVINILTNVKSALKNDGVLFIAIENRMGLKYWMGASEDHYNQPHIGLYGYPHDNGIKTYDKKEWDHILKMADMKYFRFLYPFPDYKLPKVILSDMYIKRDKYAYSLLYRIYSRDYVKAWQPESDEFLLWKSLHQSGYLVDFVNSFFILISDDIERLTNVIPYDFVHFPDTGRKPGYRVVTMKPQNKDHIVKKKMTDIDLEEKNTLIKQDLSSGKYYRGPLLVSLWLDSLVKCNDMTSFEKLIQGYYRFLLKYFNKQDTTFNAFDLTPFNIILDNTGAYRIIDREWVVNTKMHPEYVLFRALLWFSRYSKTLLSQICEINNIFNIKDFIDYGFSLVSLSLDPSIDEFIEMEELIQKEVTFQKDPHFIRSMLSEPLKDAPLDLQPETFLTQLYWAEVNKGFCEEKCVSVTAPLRSCRQVLFFKLPPSIHNLQRLRFNPGSGPGFFHLFRVMLKWSDLEKRQKKVLWQFQGAQEIAQYSQMEDIHFYHTSLGEVLLSMSENPQIIFEPPPSIQTDTGEGVLQFEVEMSWPKSVDELIVKDVLGREIASQVQQIKARESVIQEKEKQIHTQGSQIKEKEQQIQVKDEYIRKIEFESNLIKQSKVWRTAEFFRRLFYCKLS